MPIRLPHTLEICAREDSILVQHLGIGPMKTSILLKFAVKNLLSYCQMERNGDRFAVVDRQISLVPDRLRFNPLPSSLCAISG